MTPPDLDRWQPCAVGEVQSILGDFTKWYLCGGESLDLLVGRRTREHADIDIGVYRSDLVECLSSIRGVVYLCDPPGEAQRWDGQPIENHVNDIWIAAPDESSWLLQILIYTDHEDTVVFKCDETMKWSKVDHTIEVDGISILNPAITLLYKASRGSLEAKDAIDISTIIEWYGSEKDA